MSRKVLSLFVSAIITILMIGGISFGMGTVHAADGDIAINGINFPDRYFRAYVRENFDENNDGELSSIECQAVYQIGEYRSARGLEDVESFKGIEYFTNLERLYYIGSYLTSLDVSKNTELTELICVGSRVDSLDFSKNLKLQSLDIMHNKLTNLDVSANKELVVLMCFFNSLTNLDVSNNTKLDVLECSYNKLTSLDVSNNPDLWRLGCSNNQ